MKKTIFQVILLLLLASFCLAGYFIGRDILELPFRETNDALHQKESSFNLDFLIPAGTHIDEKMTIGEVIKIRARKETSLYRKIVRPLSELIPYKYRIIANLFLFFFWTFLFMTFFRIFTFMGYGRALRGSLFLGGCTYYYMPDFMPGSGDDLFFIGMAVLIIVIRACIHHREKKRSKLRA
jgi:hypothetical protein